jgi:hypothetical protein
MQWPSLSNNYNNNSYNVSSSGVTLVVSDWAESNDLTEFLLPAVNITRTAGASFPFTSVSIVTQDSTTAATASSHTNYYKYFGIGISATGRNWTLGGAEWDFCTSQVDTMWFVAVSTRFRARDSIELPISTGLFSCFCFCFCFAVLFD